MTEILLLMALGLTTILVIVVTEKSTGFLNIRNLSVMGFFALTYSLNIVGGILVFFQRQDVSDGIRYSYLAMIFLGFIGICIGSVLISMWKHFDPEETKKFLSSDFKTCMPVYGIFPSVLIIIGLAGLIFIAYSRILPSLPIAYLLSSDIDAVMLKLVRASGYKTLPNYITHPMNFIRMVLFPYLIVLTFLLVHKFRTNRLRALFMVTFLSGIVFNSYTTALFPVVMLFAILLLAFWITRSIKIRHLPLILSGALAFPLLSAILAHRSIEISSVVTKEIIRHLLRFIYEIPDILLSYVTLYWDAGSRLMGSAHRPLSILLGQESLNVSNIVFLYRNPSGYYLGNASAPFVGHLYADFGLWGVFTGAIITGIILQGVHIYCVRRENNLFNLALYIMVIWAGFATTSTNITTGLLSKGLIPVLFLPFIMKIVCGFWERVGGKNCHAY
ncbi:MAG: hypothetical protein ACMUHX_07840 [bacterium]